MNLQGRKFNFSFHQYQNLYIGTPNGVLIPTTTSIDGKPFMTPNEFEILMTKEKSNGITHTALKELSELNKEENGQASQATTSSHPSTAENSNKRTTDENSYLFQSEEESLEKRKKVKKERKSNSRQNSSSKVKAKNEKSHKKTIVKSVKNTKTMLKKTHQKKISGLQYDKVKKDLMFEIQGYGETNSNRGVIFSRKELVEKDPLLLLYFYEQCLEFSKDPDFESKNLIKL